MKKSFLILNLLLGAVMVSFGQWIEVIPENPSADDAVTILFHADEGGAELVGETKVYMHHGVVTAGPDGRAWEQVVGNWGQDDGVGEMTLIEDNTWQYEIAPTVSSYFNLTTGQNAFRISAVFRSADGSAKASLPQGDYSWGEIAPNGDAYIDLNLNNFLILNTPNQNEVFLPENEVIEISASASSVADSIVLFIDDGEGEQRVSVQRNVRTFSFDYQPRQDVMATLRLVASINGEQVETIQNIQVTLVGTTTVAPAPEGIVPGVSYSEAGDQAYFGLIAPGKQFVHLVGDFNNWMVSDAYLMQYDPQQEMFWYVLDDIEPGKAYVYQYWVEGDVRIGDPYGRLVADPYNDGNIPTTVYPDIPQYDKTAYGIATVFNSQPETYEWSAAEANWQRPNIDHLVVYEMLVRDFVANHSYQEVIDSLDYIKRLGVNAIELMPVMEFENNESWGYNTSYIFAVDKYYGSANDLKALIDAAHQKGIAVIADIVLNHAYGQSPMVQMYFDQANNRPTRDNPWFNAETVGPFEFGYDFNHESSYTKDFVDDVNRYWLEEFHFDGYRFDFTKGFTNQAPNNNLDNYDQSRIDNLVRMGNVIKEYAPDAYLILEHFAAPNEEAVLAAEGFKMWRNKSYDYVPLAVGNPRGTLRGADALSHITYFNSHDERRITEHMLTEGLSEGAYNVKDTAIMLERAKMVAAFNFLLPGPKMLWMFDEWGYDLDINLNGRTGNKPLPWGAGSLQYDQDPLRQYVRDAYQAIIQLRNTITPESLMEATTAHKLTGSTRVLNYDMGDTSLVVLANFGLTEEEVRVDFPRSGQWYDYFSGDSIQIVPARRNFQLQPGEWYVLTSVQLSEGYPNVVEYFESPVTISPYPFTPSDEITIRYDATKGSFNNTDGLVDAEKVYMHAGFTQDFNNSVLEREVGNLTDDGVGEMVSVGDNIWEITLVPAEYFNLAPDEDMARLAMFFRDAQNVNQGYGFRGRRIFFEVDDEAPFITVTPSEFEADTEITIRFNARKGNRELVGANKVYMHSSVDITDSTNPQSTAWSRVVGNWGQDDGIGQMTKVEGESDIWEITLVPQEYYQLGEGEHPYWIAAVFRNANGAQKGTGTPGDLPNGFIAANQDFFIRNGLVSSIQNVEYVKDLVYPNPTSSLIHWQDRGADFQQAEIYNMQGQRLITAPYWRQSINVSGLSAGVYYLLLRGEKEIAISKWIKS